MHFILTGRERAHSYFWLRNVSHFYGNKLRNVLQSVLCRMGAECIDRGDALAADHRNFLKNKKSSNFK